MVMNNEQLDLIFNALSDQTRRSMLMRLLEGEMNLKTLAEPYDISQPAISKHVRVLERAGLIEKTVHGRESRIRPNPIQAQIARDWINYYVQFWDEQFDAIDKHIQMKEDSDDQP